MKKMSLEMRRTLATILVLVLLYNNVFTQNWLVSAAENGQVSTQTVDYVITYPEDGKFSVSCGDTDWQGYTYVIPEGGWPKGSVSCGDYLSVSGCDLPCEFTVNKLDAGGALVKAFAVIINKIPTKLVFAEDPKVFIYGSSTTYKNEASVSGGDADNREIEYAVVSGNDIATVSDDGTLTFNDNQFGDVVVTASVSCSDKYAETVEKYTVKVQNESTPSPAYILKDGIGQVITGEGPYNHSVYIWPQENYLISESNSLMNNDWKDYLALTEDGSYNKVFYLKNLDGGGITAEITADISVDIPAAEVCSVSYSDWETAVDLDTGEILSRDQVEGEYKDNTNVRLYYKTGAEVAFEITKENFDKERIEVTDNNSTVQDNSRLSMVQDENDKSKWTVTYSIPLEEKGDHIVKLTYKDVSVDKDVSSESKHIYVDGETASLGEVSYDWDNVISAEEVESMEEISVENAKNTAGVRLYYKQETSIEFNLTEKSICESDLQVFDNDTLVQDSKRLLIKQTDTGTKITYTIPVTEAGDHEVKLIYQDRAQNGVINHTSKLICMDEKPAELKKENITYSDWVSAEDLTTGAILSKEEAASSNNVRLFYNADATISFIITEANFRKTDVQLKDNGTSVQEGENLLINEIETGKWKVIYTVSDGNAGDHKVELSYQDRAQNGEVNYTSKLICMDDKPAELKKENITYSDWVSAEDLTTGAILSKEEAASRDNVRLFYNADATISFIITEANFRKGDVQLRDNDTLVPEGEYLSIEPDKTESNKWKVTYIIPTTKPGDHKVSLVYLDRAENKELCPELKLICMDEKPAELKKEDILYSDWINAEDLSTGAILSKEEAASSDNVRLFYNADATISFIITEVNFRKGDVQLRDNDTLVQEGEYLSIVETEKGKWTVTYKILAIQAGDHEVKLTYQDRAQNGEINYTSKLICMDDKPAELKKENITYSDWVSAEDLTTGAILSKEEAASRDNVRLFYNADATISFIITEANFRKVDVRVKDNGNSVEEGENLAINEIETGKWRVSYTVSDGNIGDHKVELSYQDRSQTEGLNYASKIICIDKTPAEFKKEDISYSDWASAEDLSTEVILSKEEATSSNNVRLFYNADATISFIITEANFRKADVQLRDNDTLVQEGEYLSIVETENDRWTVTYKIPTTQAGDHEVRLTYQDRAQKEELSHTSKLICMDDKPAELKKEDISYSDWASAEDLSTEAVLSKEEAASSDNVRLFYNADATISFIITEANFRKADVQLIDNDTLVQKGENFSIEQIGQDKWKVIYTILDEKAGDHVVRLTYRDRVENKELCQESKLICIDKTPVELKREDITYSDWINAEDLNSQAVLSKGGAVSRDDVRIFYNADATISFIITESNFRKEDVQLRDNDALVQEGENFSIEQIGQDKWKVIYTISDKKAGDHKVELSYQDRAQTEGINYTSKIICIDKTPAELKKEDISYSDWVSAEDLITKAVLSKEEAESRDDVRIFYNADAKISFIITEENFRKADVQVRDNDTPVQEGEYLSIEETEKGKWTITYQISVTQAGDHEVTLSYQDRALNGEVTCTSKRICMDNSAAQCSNVSYSEWKYAKDDTKLYYNEDMAIEFTIVEANFRMEDVQFSDTYGASKVNSTPTLEEGTNENEWIITYIIHKEDEGEHVVTLKYQDRADNTPAIVYTTKTIVMDTTAAVAGEIAYHSPVYEDSGKVYFNKDAIVSFEITERNFHKEGVSVSEELSRLPAGGTWECTLVEGTSDTWLVNYYLPISEEGEYKIVLYYNDPSKNKQISFTSKNIVMDDTPAIFKAIYDESKWEYAEDLRNNTKLEKYNPDSMPDNREDVRLFYKTDATFKFTITEEHFEEEKITFKDSFDTTIDASVLNWTRENENSNVWSATYTIFKDKEGEHILELKYDDPFEMGDISYISEHIIMDSTIAILNKVQYNDNVESGDLEEHKNLVAYHNEDVHVTFEIEEANFYQQDVELRDSFGGSNENIVLEWKQEDDNNKNLWTATYEIPKADEGVHVVTLSYQDRSDTGEVKYTSKTIIIDTTPAVFGEVEYSEWETAESLDTEVLLDKEEARVRNDVRIYYKNDVDIVLEITETNFDERLLTIVDKYENAEKTIELEWNPVNGVKDIWSATYTIPATEQGEHVVTLKYQDQCKNGEPIDCTLKRVLIDTTESFLDEIYLNDWTKVSISATGSLINNYEAGSRSDVHMFYNESASISLVIKEKYFNDDDVIFTDSFKSSQNNIVLTWEAVEGEADTWTATYKIDATEEGEHVLKLSYQDRSCNNVVTYTSEHIIMDCTEAKLSGIEYNKWTVAEEVSTGNMVSEYVAGTSKGMKLYFNEDVKMTFEITEANFYKADVVLKDIHNGTSRIKEVEWTQGTGDKQHTWTATYEIPVSEEGEHVITLFYQDRSENIPAINFTSECIIVDHTASDLSKLEYNVWVTAEDINTKERLQNHNAGNNVDNVRLYYREDMTVTFEITEDNFIAGDVILKDSYDTTNSNIVLAWKQGTGENHNKWTAEYMISAEKAGEHILTLVYQDRSENEPKIEYTSESIIMDPHRAELVGVEFTDWILAVVSTDFIDLVDYEERQGEDVNLYYADDMTMTFTIAEANFNADDVVFKDSYDISSSPIKLNWSQGSEGEWTAEYIIKKSQEGAHVITLYYQDRSENMPIKYVSETIIMDDTKPEIIPTYKEGLDAYTVDDNGVAYYGDSQTVKICIREDNFRASEVEITMLTEDAVEVVDVESLQAYLKDASNWEKTAEGNVTTIDIKKDAKYDIRINYSDLASHDAKECSINIVVDKIDPIRVELETSVAYDTDSCTRMVDNDNNTVLVADDETRFIYNDAMVFTYVMEEINFNAEDVEVFVYRDGEKLTNNDGYSYAYDKNWARDTTTPYNHVLTLQLGMKDGVLVDGDYQVEINYIDLAGHSLKTYTSNVMSIDKTTPDIKIEYDNMEVNNDFYYNKDRIATITITDRNVVPAEIEVEIDAIDIDGNKVPFDAASKQTSWEPGEEPYTWVSKIFYDADANYEFSILCVDMATNSNDDADSFTVDETAPNPDSFTFEYSSPLKEEQESDVSNSFYKDLVMVKITAEDLTSPIEYFEWSYIKQEGASIVNQVSETHIIRKDDNKFTYDATKRTATVELVLTAEQAKQYRGNIRFKATDMAGNTSVELTDVDRIVVVDTISPTRQVAYSPATQIVNEDTLNTVSGFEYASENVGAVLVYDAPMSITFKVNEANFYGDDIVVKVNNTEAKVMNWSKSGDDWTGSLTLVDDGEYIVSLQYMDRSANEMVAYVSHQIIIDTVRPKISVDYGPNNVKQQIDGIKYYDEKQTATITIIERNFRADDIEVVVTAKDVNGGSIEITDYDSYLKNRSNWVTKDDRHTANVTFATDANYEFDITYKDLALISADDYSKDVFTVDQTPPTNISVSYSSPIFEKTSQGIAYGFYNQPIIVTITAEDDISGVHSFDYSYIRADGVSSVNLGNVANKIETQNITYSNGKRTATATFVLPSSELREGNQINGTMEYVASNRSLMSGELKDSKRFVVDNIAPSVNVEFSDSVRNANNVSYYAGDINVTITINEANFYAEDVSVSIAKDGAEQSPVEVEWSNLSVDKHVGTFTLYEEGDYRVYVSYHDPSTNKMNEYQSNQLTIDTTPPTVAVSGIKHMSANKQEQIGFVVTVEDTNLDVNSLSPQLLAELRDESGAIQQINCTELGTVETIVNGKSCTYIITNIENDGIYNFSCVVLDMSGNRTEDMVIEDSGNTTVSVLEYSINRNGSVYGLDDSTKELNNSFVKQAGDVVIYEINPDEIWNVRITLFKNEQTIVLQEGKDYIISKMSEGTDWYKYAYTIYAANFDEDGTYRISVYSEDKAGNIAENTLDVKDMEINFGVDKTLPNLVLTNLERNTTYPLDKLSVLMQATDNMKLVSVKVDLDGKEIAFWDEEQIQQMSSNSEDFVFDIWGTETFGHTVTITLTDIVGNKRVEELTDVFVTRNIWVRFTNNKVLFYGSIIACVFIGTSFILLWRRKKRKREEMMQ